MATKYSTQYDSAYVSNSKVGYGDVDGQKRSMYAEYVMGEAITAADVIKICKLPKGARVIDITVITPAFGGAGELDVGWLINDDEAASQNGFIDALATGAIEKMSATYNATGLYKLFTAETDIVITGTVTTTATTGTIKVVVDYTVV